jgi:hypothetical protein
VVGTGSLRAGTSRAAGASCADTVTEKTALPQTNANAQSEDEMIFKRSMSSPFFMNAIRIQIVAARRGTVKRLNKADALSANTIRNPK